MWEAIGGRTAREIAAADPVYRRWLVRERRAGRFLAWIVEDADHRPLGSGAIWLAPVQPRPGRLGRPHMPYLLSMYTEPESRGRGVASRVVRAAIAWARRRGYSRLTLHASKWGRPVYRRLGFVPGSEMRVDLDRGVTGRRRRR
jgi:GNAT superfamily N-acetyltransferase